MSKTEQQSAPQLVSGLPELRSEAAVLGPQHLADTAPPQAVLQAPEPTTSPTVQTSKYPALPYYALKYAPILWLYGKERYWPGNPLHLLRYCVPQDANGAEIPFPKSLTGEPNLLELPSTDQENVWLTLATDDPRIDENVPYLTANHGKPDPQTRRSNAPVWIVMVDKSKIVGPGVVDIFYCYFYPYNLGNVVLGTNFGNHVGDWEHSMVRFLNGEPTGVFYSAHSDGHAWAWSTMEKLEGRPVDYVASGSHANYGKNGAHMYTAATFLGPIDYTNKGVLWDPVLNYTAASYDPSTSTFSSLSAAVVPAKESGSGKSTTLEPAMNAEMTPEDVLAVLDFKGYWGNSFSELKKVRNQQPEWLFWLPNAIRSLKQKIEALKWTQGPQGPRWKSLERKGVDWSTEKLLPNLV